MALSVAFNPLGLVLGSALLFQIGISIRFSNLAGGGLHVINLIYITL
jgi:hypothetical protein